MQLRVIGHWRQTYGGGFSCKRNIDRAHLWYSGWGSGYTDCAESLSAWFWGRAENRHGSSFAVGITNPAAVITFRFAFSYFGITGNTTALQGIWLVAGVFIGTFLWWVILSASVVFLKRKIGKHGSRYMNQIFGAVLILFGTVVFIRILL